MKFWVECDYQGPGWTVRENAFATNPSRDHSPIWYATNEAEISEIVEAHHRKVRQYYPNVDHRPHMRVVCEDGRSVSLMKGDVNEEALE